MHIVEELITERAQKLIARPRLWRALRPTLYKLLGYEKAAAMADAVRPLSGRAAFAHVGEVLGLRLDVRGVENIPASGPLMIIANHPTGLADGVFVYGALKTARPNHIFMANADALRVIPKCEDIIIPVEWVKDKRTHAKTRQTLAAMKAAISNQQAIVIFPSGVLAHLGLKGLTDKDWNPTAISMAKKHNVTIVPLKIKSRNSALYYALSKLNNELRDITLFHELLNKKGQSPKLTFGAPIDPSTLPRNTKQATQAVRDIVEKL